MKFEQFHTYLASIFLLLVSGHVWADSNNNSDESVYVPVTDMFLKQESGSASDSTTQRKTTASPAADISDTEDDEEADELPPPPFFSFLDDHQKLVSNRVEQYSESIDSFFTGSGYVNEQTGSYIRLRLGIFWPEGSGMELDSGLSIRLHLPRTQKKLKLVIASDPDEQKNPIERETGELSPETSGSSKAQKQEDIDNKFRWKFDPSIGIKIRSPLDWYVRFKGQRQVTFNKWLMSFEETLYWFDSTGAGTDTLLRWDRPISNKFLFRSDSFVRYTTFYKYFEMSQSFSLTQTLSEKRAITYKVGVFSQSEPTIQATTYLINAVYRNNIHKDYLFLDIQPQIFFEKENDFKARSELLIRFEIFYRG
jgi:hypothetical protein